MYSQSSRNSIGGYSQNYKTEDLNNDGLLAKYYRMNQKSAGTAASKNVNPSPSPLTQRVSISAWGIIAIILGVIVFSTITYYVFILYPFICKKDQTYDSIELTEVNSVCTVSDNANNVPLYRNSNDVSNDISLNR